MASNLGFRQLRYFLAIAEAGSLSRAAETLNIAQSALSHHVAEIEASLSVKLFERRARGVTLTAAGHRLCEHAGAILAALEKAEEDVRTFVDVASGPVSVGLSHTAIEIVARDVMKQVRSACPAVHMTLAEGLSPTLIQRVLSGSLDLAIAYNPPKDPRLKSEVLLEEDLYLVGVPGLIGKSTRAVAFADIPQDSVLGLSPVPASRAIIQTQILRNRIAPNATLEVDSLTALRQALEEGLGCAILSRATVRNELVSGKFHARKITAPDLSRALCLISLADQPQTRAIVEVRAVLKEVVETAVRAGRWPLQGKPTLASPKSARKASK